MNNKRLSQTLLNRSIKVACACSLISLLSSCGEQEKTENPAPAVTSARPAVSAAELIQHDMTSLSAAQGVAAGVIPVTDLVTQTTSASSIPTVNSTSDSVPAIGAALPGLGTSTTSLNTTPVAANISENTSIGESPTTTISAPPTSAPPTANSQTSIPDLSSSAPDSLESTADVNVVNSASQVTNPVATDNVATDTVAHSAASAVPDTTTNSVASALPDTATSAAENTPTVRAASFSSITTPGFTGTLRTDGSIRVTWKKDPTARGYNVYRQAKFVESVFTEEFIDANIFDEDYYYEIQAFDTADNLNYVATGLTVSVSGLDKTNPQSPVPTTPSLNDYELVFSDEFNATELDYSKWNTQYLWGADLVINSEEQYYVDSQNDKDFGFNPFEVRDGSLTIKSIPTPAALLQKANNQPYLSGLITSYDAFKFTYGYVETRAKAPYGQGLWSAFWLLNAYYIDDKPEIDIMEQIGHDQDVVYHTYHYYDADGQLRSTESKPTPGIDFTSNFHTYAVEWKPGTIVYYVDGIERHRVSDPKVSQQDMYIIANTALGGWWPGSPDVSTLFPAEYEIDYIRAYQKREAFDDVPFFDYTTKVPLADDVPGTSPNHIPAFELWPQAYPERQ